MLARSEAALVPSSTSATNPGKRGKKTTPAPMVATDQGTCRIQSMMNQAEQSMKTFIVEYTNEDLLGNQVLTMEIDASDLEEAYDIMEDLYPNLAVDVIYAQ
jgi:DNA-binding IscR family transcriptional regulator